MKGKNVYYSFGFNGMEKDNELYGTGNAYTTEFREVDPRLGGRWWSIDPLIKPGESPYVGFSDNPIVYSDPMGADPVSGDGDPGADVHSSARDLPSSSSSSSGVGNDGDLHLPNQLKTVPIYGHQDKKRGSWFSGALNSIRNFFKNAVNKIGNFLNRFLPNSITVGNSDPYSKNMPHLTDYNPLSFWGRTTYYHDFSDFRMLVPFMGEEPMTFGPQNNEYQSQGSSDRAVDEYENSESANNSTNERKANQVQQKAEQSAKSVHGNEAVMDELADNGTMFLHKPTPPYNSSSYAIIKFPLEDIEVWKYDDALGWVEISRTPLKN